MRYKLILGIALIFVVVGVIALSMTNIMIDLSAEKEQALSGVNITNPEISELVCDGETCKATIFQDDGINMQISVPQYECLESNQTGCANKKEYSAEELQSLRDSLIEWKLNKIAEATLQREGKSYGAKVGAGSVTID